MHREANLVAGTSGWAYKDWAGPFYPEKTPQKRYLEEYAKKFSAVEIDSTFYAIPRKMSVEAWAQSVPDSFIFSPKFPRVISHEKLLGDCDAELYAFLDTMAILGDKLGPLVLQFDYTFRFERCGDLRAFLKKIPGEFRIAVEVRHRGWLRPEFFAMLGESRASLVLQDLHYMPRQTEVTADFVYIRLLGNRKEIPDDFSRVRIDRRQDFEWWVERVREFLAREIDVFLFINNRYQGHAPASVRTFLEMLKSGAEK